jgi:hypothetical protein
MSIEIGLTVLFSIMIIYWIWVVVMGIRDNKNKNYDSMVARNLICATINIGTFLLIQVIIELVKHPPLVDSAGKVMQ